MRTFTEEHKRNLSLSHLGQMTEDSNPSKKLESRLAISLGRRGKGIGNQCALGHDQIAWNKGLTKETSEIVRQYTETGKKAMSEALRNAWLKGKFANRKHFSFGKGGVRKDLGHFVRSTNEANVCRLLKFFGVQYLYEPKRFVLKEGGMVVGSYLPDLYVPELKSYIEIKGWWNKNSIRVVDLFLKNYDLPLIVVDETADGLYWMLWRKYSMYVIWESDCDIVRTEQKCSEESRNVFLASLLKFAQANWL